MNAVTALKKEERAWLQLDAVCDEREKALSSGAAMEDETGLAEDDDMTEPVRKRRTHSHSETSPLVWRGGAPERLKPRFGRFKRAIRSLLAGSVRLRTKNQLPRTSGLEPAAQNQRLRTL